MAKRILITGGAGFIGSHLCDELLNHGYSVRVLDCLAEQVHGPGTVRPDFLNPQAELIVGDVRDAETVTRALIGVDSVVHLAAVVGVGQSMYEIARYTSTNNFGTAVLLQCLINHGVERLVVASSMSVYGEGLYRNPAGELANGLGRTTDQLKQQEWEICNAAGERLAPIPTPETKQCSLASFYALSKFDQEQLSLLFGRTYRVPTVALRFFNVYGPRQSLSNPYTGVLAIFASRLLNNNRPLIFEDGLQRRDFVNVSDVARACRLALEASSATSVFNIGSGQSTTILEIAQEMAGVIGRSDLQPLINGEYRKGDIRHCFADISLARNILEFEPRVIFAQGITELAEWLATQVAIDRVSEHRAELVARGLTI